MRSLNEADRKRRNLRMEADERQRRTERAARNTQQGNVVVHQKEEIIADIDCGRYDDALSKLSVLTGLWVSADYAYKGHELCKRMAAMLSEDANSLNPRSNAFKRVAHLRHEVRIRRAIFSLQSQAIDA